jgi:hypothetical protein
MGLYSKYGDQKIPAVIELADDVEGQGVLDAAEAYAQEYAGSSEYAAVTVLQLNRLN